jgi:hypothetical protein
MALYTRTCTLTTVAAACVSLACGDDGRADADATNVTTVPSTPSEATTSSTSEPPVPTTSDGTAATTVTPDTDPVPTDPTVDPPTSDTSVTATTPTSDTTDGSSSTGAVPCAQGELVCDGDTAKVCDGVGGFESEQPCDSVCAPDLGCVACLPGAGQCAGDVAQVCKPDGSGYDDGPSCDPLLGLACDPDVGACVGACALLDGLSYIGCDYYPVVTAQLDNFIDDEVTDLGFRAQSCGWTRLRPRSRLPVGSHSWVPCLTRACQARIGRVDTQQARRRRWPVTRQPLN